MQNRLAAAAATLSCVLATLIFADGAAKAATTVGTETATATTKVAIADLDLGSEAGVKALKRRIDLAAGKLCLKDGVEALAIKAARQGCYRTALSDGNRQADQVLAMRGDRSARGKQAAKDTATAPVRL